MFGGRKLLIVTKHKKEEVIAPVLEQELQVYCFTDASFDTDMLGTFTGEVERKDDPLTTARNKCLLAMEKNQCDLAVASEGSFGPHPVIPFVPADDEWMILIDKKQNLELKARTVSAETNFAGRFVSTEKELNAFLEAVQFPSHAVILRKSREESADIYKGLTDHTITKATFQKLLEKYNRVFVETDMRAMLNPTRMKVIEQLALKLASLIKSVCPACGRPGFGVTDIVPGLPCEQCSAPTKSPLKNIYVCGHCGYRKEQLYPKDKQFEDPMFCDTCNP